MASTAKHNSPSESESGGVVDTQIVEEDSSSPPSELDEEWKQNLKLKMEQAFTGELLPAQPEEAESMICRFPPRGKLFRGAVVRDGNFSTPKVVAIGPLHREESLCISDNNKWVIVNLMNKLYKLDLKSCLSKMKNQVANTHKRYFKLDTAQGINSEEDESFAEMLLLDSCFILFMLTVKIEERPLYYILMPTTNSVRTVVPDDTTTVLNWILDKDSIAPDLLILGNQIPFFVIEELFKELNLEKPLPLHMYALEYFETIHPLSIQGRSIEERKEDQNSPPKFLHLLDLFHWSRVPKDKYKKLSSFPGYPHFIDLKSCRIPSAMELRQSATMFEKKMFGSTLDITFRKHRFIPIIRVLHIPKLHVRSYSELIFQNLIAFEQHVSSKGCCTMTFVALVGNLLQSEEDVKLLRQHRILVCSSRHVGYCRNLFRLTENQQKPSDLQQKPSDPNLKKKKKRSDLPSQMPNDHQQMPKSDLDNICHEVQSYYDSVVIRFFRLVILRYFSNPLVIFSVFVAVLAFVPTLVQTIYSILSYIHRT